MQNSWIRYIIYSSVIKLYLNRYADQLANQSAYFLYASKLLGPMSHECMWQIYKTWAVINDKISFVPEAVNLKKASDIIELEVCVHSSK